MGNNRRVIRRSSTNVQEKEAENKKADIVVPVESIPKVEKRRRSARGGGNHERSFSEHYDQGNDEDTVFDENNFFSGDTETVEEGFFKANDFEREISLLREKIFQTEEAKERYELQQRIDKINERRKRYERKRDLSLMALSKRKIEFDKYGHPIPDDIDKAMPF